MTENQIILPPEGPEDHVKVTWERGDEGVVIGAVLGEASVEIACSYKAVETIPWLVAALPSVLDMAWAEIEKLENTEEALGE